MSLIPPRLRDTDIDVLVATVEEVQCAPWFSLDCLDRREMARADGYKLARHRKRYQARHVLLRHVLAVCGGWDPAGIVFGSVGNGKPVVTDPPTPTINFNMSSSENQIAIAISPKVPVGVDIERIVTARYNGALAKRFFTSEEARSIDNADQPTDTFFMYWSVKESVIKILGHGLSMPLDAVRIKISKSKRISLYWVRRDWAPAEVISVEAEQLDGGYALALAHFEDEVIRNVNYIGLSDL